MPRKLDPRTELIKVIKDHTPTDKHPDVNPYASVQEAIFDNDILTDPNDPLWGELLADQDVQYLINKGKLLKMRRARQQCYNLAFGDPDNGIRPNERFMQIYLKLIADDDQLARLGGGGIKLEDVRALGDDNRKTLVIQPTVVQQLPEKKAPKVDISDAEIIPDSNNDK